MKKIIYLLAILVFTSTSCIDWGLEKLPVYDEVEITDFDLEFRYTSENANGVKSMVFTTLNSVADISKENATITVTATIPPPTSVFTSEIRRSISLNNIASYAKLSPAAKIEPLDGSPVLGVPGDFSIVRKYRVTAADGKTTKDWTVKINPLPVINKYEGSYYSTGALYYGFYDGTGDYYDISRSLYLGSINETTCTTSHGSTIWGEPYTLQLKVNADNTVTVTQHNAAGAVVGEMFPGKENRYDPVTKTFHINYRSLQDTPYVGSYVEAIVMK